MRSPIELEAQLNLMAARLLYDLSEGIIDDDEYHLRMYGHSVLIAAQFSVEPPFTMLAQSDVEW